jgi:hypothetical protein
MDSVYSHRPSASEVERTSGGGDVFDSLALDVPLRGFFIQ